MHTYDFSGLPTAVVSAYYSVAVQQEYLGEIDRAALNYNAACQAAARRLRHGDPLSTFVRNASASFRTVSSRYGPDGTRVSASASLAGQRTLYS